MTCFKLRPLARHDSLEALTDLVHRAYARLGDMGLNYTAVDQTVAMTRERVARGHCVVIERVTDGSAKPHAAPTLVATVTVNGPFDVNRDPWARATPWYYRADVAHLHQFAVDPSLQGQGLGVQLIDACEAWAREQGHRALALDTAVSATHLRTLYERHGFVNVDEVAWPGKRYRSVVMLKALQPGPAGAPTEHDQEHRCARVRTLWAHTQARDWQALRALLHADCVTTWPATRERFEGADLFVRVQSEYPEGWSIHVNDVCALADGRVTSEVTETHGDQAFIAASHFAFDVQGLITRIHEVWATTDAPPSWRKGWSA